MHTHTRAHTRAKVDIHSQEVSVPPIALTPRFAGLFRAVSRSLRHQQPILVTGPPGCGKSTAVRALAAWFGASLREVYMTAEAESSILVGCMQPKVGNRPGPSIEWQDGAITSSVQDGSWVLLDNIGDTDPLHT